MIICYIVRGRAFLHLSRKSWRKILQIKLCFAFELVKWHKRINNNHLANPQICGKKRSIKTRSIESFGPKWNIKWINSHWMWILRERFSAWAETTNLYFCFSPRLRLRLLPFCVVCYLFPINHLFLCLFCPLDRIQCMPNRQRTHSPRNSDVRECDVAGMVDDDFNFFPPSLWLPFSICSDHIFERCVVPRSRCVFALYHRQV